jgi:hypothetical protein
MVDRDQEGELSLVDQNGTTPVDPEEIKGQYEEYKVP